METGVRQHTTSHLNGFLEYTTEQLIYLSWLVELPQDKPVTINVLFVTDTDGSAFNTRSQTHACLTTHISPHHKMLYQMYQTQKILHQNPWQVIVASSPTDAENWPFCKRISKKFIKWEAPQHKTDLFTPCKRLTVQTCNVFWSEIPSSGHTQVLEVYCIGWNSWLTRSPGKHPYLLS